MKISTGGNVNTTSGSGGDEQKTQSQEFSSPEEKMKAQLLQELIKKQINIDDNQLGKIFGFNNDQIKYLRMGLKRQGTLDQAEQDIPYTWDYVLCFEVGSEEEKEKHKPTKKEKKEYEKRKNTDDSKPGDEDQDAWNNGISEHKYFGQIFADIWERLEKTNAKLKVQAFRSGDKKYMFLLVGILEKDLKEWADERDTDLLLDPEGACRVGREKGFPLAQRTKLNADETDPNVYTLPLANWKSMYAEYNSNADLNIYTKYNRVVGDETSPKTVFDEKTRLRLIYEAMIADDGEGGAELRFDDYILNKHHPLLAVFPLHNEKVLEEFRRDWLYNTSPRSLMWCPLDRVRNYFGEPVAFYYAFIQFYMHWLIYPSVVGLIFFIEQLGFERVDAPGVWLMCFFIIFWAVAFVDFWAREEAKLRLQWGMTKFQTKAVARPQFRGEWKHDTVTGRWSEYFNPLHRGARSSGVVSLILLFLGGCIAAVISVLIVRDSNPNDILLKIGLGVANGAMISIFDNLYKIFSRYGNDVENHRTQQDYENALILKSFFFKFFNSFSSLFYLSFVRPYTAGDAYYILFSNACGDECVKSDVCTYWVAEGKSIPSITNGECDSCSDTDCLNSNFEYQYFDVCSNGDLSAFLGGTSTCVSDVQLQVNINKVVLNEVRIQLATLFGTALFIQNFFEVFFPWLFEKLKGDKAAKEYAAQHGDEAVFVQSEAEATMQKGPYASTIDDMSELIVQFGYVTLFVLAFPITPLLALFNNVVEMRVDAHNILSATQRPHPNGSYGLGAWNSVLQFFSFICVGTNVAICTWRTRLVEEAISSNGEWKWIFFSVVSVVLALIIAFEKFIIPDVPLDVEEAMSRQENIEGILVKGQRIDQDRDEPPDDDDTANYVAFNPSAQFIDVDTLQDIPMNQPLCTYKPNQ
jgi:hypothetical protein